MKFDLSKRPGVKTGIQLSDYCDAGERLDVNVYTIRAVDAVESAGGGFLSRSKRPKILFEGHYFYKFLKRKGLHKQGLSEIPTICYRRWTKRHYKGREAEYGRLAAATEFCHRHKISDEWALRSASWGRFQIMGENFRKAGFGTVQQFVEAMFQSEANHLAAFAEYIDRSHLDDELIKADRNPGNLKAWRAFARGYNGPGYRRNRYGVKLRAAALKFRKTRYDCKQETSDVAEILPSDRSTNPAEEGFENTSLDNRYEEGEVLAIGLDIPGMGPATSGEISGTIFDNTPDGTPEKPATSPSQGFKPILKEEKAPPKEGSTKKAAAMTVLGFAVPAFLTGVFEGIGNWIEKGYIDVREVMTAALQFTQENTKYVLILVGLIIVILIVKKLTRQITTWVKMWINTDPKRHDVDVIPQ